MNKKLALKMAVFLFALVDSYRRSDPFHPMVRIAITVLDMVVDMCLAKDRSNIWGVCVSPNWWNNCYDTINVQWEDEEHVGWVSTQC